MAALANLASQLLKAADDAAARFVASEDGTIIDGESIGDTISAQRQARHILGSP